MHLLWFATHVLPVVGLATANNAVVDLPYASYKGTQLPNGITQWLGIRFAAPPLGKLRFAAPQDPVRVNGTQLADQHGPYCLATASGPPTNATNEDCLFLDVYAPTHVKRSSGLPVYFFMQGGGFNIDSNPNYNGSGLITAGDMDLVVVAINYRVGPFGFLAGDEIRKGASLNNGLKDQRKAMEWVQQNIRKFGGDPGHVTFGGDSAGAQSVNLHVTAYGGRNDHLFHASTAESQSFSQLSTVEQSQPMYDDLVIRAECTSANDTLACLRTLTTAELQAINIQTPFIGATAAPLFMYGPTLDYDFVTDYTLRAYAQGKFVRIPAIAGDVTNEGSVFAPNTTSSMAETNAFIRNQYPSITLAQLAKVEAMYPVEGTPTFPGCGRYWRQAANAYGEVRNICPTIDLSDIYASANGNRHWNYRWNVIDPTDNASGLGVHHTIEINGIWGPENTQGDSPLSYYPGGVNAAIVPVMQAYWTSFIRTYNPNTYRLPGTPKWETWLESQTTLAAAEQPANVQSILGRRMRFQTNATAMENVSPAQRARCAFWSEIGLSIKE